MREVGRTIAQLRRENGLRQKDLSEILNMSTSNISNYENSAYWPDLGTLCQLADYFHVTTDYLLGRSDYRCPPEILDRYITTDSTIHEIVNTLLTMDSDALKEALTYMGYLREKQDRAGIGKTKQDDEGKGRSSSRRKQPKGTSRK